MPRSDTAQVQLATNLPPGEMEEPAWSKGCSSAQRQPDPSLLKGTRTHQTVLQGLVCRLCSRTAWGSPALSASALLASFIRKLVVVLRLLSSGYCQRGTEVWELLSAQRKWQLPRHLLQGLIITRLWLRLPRLSQTSQRVTQHGRLLHSQPSQVTVLCPHLCPGSDVQLPHSLPCS